MEVDKHQQLIEIIEMADRLNKDGSPYKFTCTTNGYKGQAVKVI